MLVCERLFMRLRIWDCLTCVGLIHQNSAQKHLIKALLSSELNFFVNHNSIFVTLVTNWLE